MVILKSEEQIFDDNDYSHLSNNRGGWNKHGGVQKLQNQLAFFRQYLS
jgi:hypothetical protein